MRKGRRDRERERKLFGLASMNRPPADSANDWRSFAFSFFTTDEDSVTLDNIAYGVWDRGKERG